MSIIQAGNTTSTSLIYTGDTTGNLVFTTGGANTVALTIDSTQNITTTNKFASASMPTGSVLQVISTTVTGSFSTSSSSWIDWTGMTVTITPKFSTSKILIMATSEVSNDTDNSFQYVKLVRGSTDIALGDAAGNATRCWMDGGLGQNVTFAYAGKPLSGIYLDSPATTSATTYKLQVIRTNAGTAYFGRTATTTDANRSAIPSSITVMEIAG